MEQAKANREQSSQLPEQKAKQPWRKPSVTYVPLQITSASANTVEDANGLGELTPG